MFPILRFKEFKEDWQQQTLADVSSDMSYGLNAAAIPYDGTNGYIRITDIDEDHIFKPVSLCSPNGELDLSYKVNVGDILFVRTGATTGKSYIYREKDGNLLYAGFLIRAAIIDAVPEFVFQQTLTAKYDKWIGIMSMRSGQPGINAKELNSYCFYAPCILEQQKIANFLSAVDEKINLLKQKHSLLQQYKKGVMQKLFKQQVRFKDDNGKDFPDWRELSMNQIVSQETREVVKPTNAYLALGVRSHMKGTFQKPDSIPEAIAMEKLFIVKTNDLVVNITFAWEGAVAIAKEIDDGGLVSHRFPTYVFNRSVTNHRYFEYIIQQKRFKYKLDAISPGGAGRNRVLSKAEFLKVKLILPSVSEQNKIADFLQTIDKKIEAVQQQIELTQTFKKGLLQQMFV